MKLQIVSISQGKLYLRIFNTILDFRNIIKYETWYYYWPFWKCKEEKHPKWRLWSRNKLFLSQIGS